MRYDVHAERWADGATAERFVALPGLSKVTVAKQWDGVLRGGRWVPPQNGVLFKTYSIQVKASADAPPRTRRIETQMLHYDGQTWHNYTYRWNDEQTDAELVAEEGDAATLTVPDATAPGGTRRLNWVFESRSQCGRCHNPWSDFAPGFSEVQLDLRGDTSHAAALGAYLDFKPPTSEPKLVDPHAADAPLERRARSWLHANCGTCHRNGGGASVPSFFNIEANLQSARVVNERPTQGSLDLPDARVVAPGDPCRSVLLLRMATTGRGHMPYAGSRLVDNAGLLLVRDWIASLKPADDVSAEALQQRRDEDAALDRLRNGDAAALDALLSTNSGALAVALAIADGSLTGTLREQAVVAAATGAASTEPLRRDLFQRFLPDDQRRVVLGDRIDPRTILPHPGAPGPGDAARGRTLFFQAGGAQCATCHRAAGQGTAFGPDLSGIGAKYPPHELLGHVLNPAKLIEPDWRPVMIEVADGSALLGFVVSRDEQRIVLKLPGGREQPIAAADVVNETRPAVSVMPDGLLANLTAQEAADLLAFLVSLRQSEKDAGR
jgi:putative heme-binding domain-containing protein